MRFRSLATLAVAALAAAVASFGGPDPVLAARRPYEDKKLGFRIHIEDSFTQNPPKLTADQAFLVGDWYEDSAKFEGQLAPMFQIFWFVEPKGVPPGPPPEAEAPAPAPDPSAPPPKEGPPAKEAPPKSKEELQKEREARRPKTLDEALNRFFSATERYFGPAVAMAERWRTAESDKTGGKIPIDLVEINAPSKKKKDEGNARAFAFVARLDIDRPREIVHVGFLAACARDHAKKYSDEFARMARSFEALKKASDSRNELASLKLSDDPKVRREQVRKTKLIPGWKAVDTDNYILLHHVDVDAALVGAIGNRIEAIRRQIYEVLFPPDEPIRDVSIVRVCKDREQYSQYGGPPGSAGYWNYDAEELVFFDMGGGDNSLRVLYHEAFHQFIFYSVGDFAPHSWFNEGHGDFFAGHNYIGGRFVRDTFSWRVNLAREWKKNPKRPPLREWIGWTQAQYYGRNKAGVDIGANYAMGWSLVYFLRTTKKPEYQGVLDRYFKSLKGNVRRGREAADAWQKKVKEAKEKGLPAPEKGDTSDVGTEDQWLRSAVDESFKGIDWDAIERDWVASDN